jgi:hypothetical protein
MDFIIRHLALAATHASLPFGGRQTGPRALDDQLALHLSEAGHHVKEKPARRRFGVDAVGDTLEMDLLGFKFIDQIDQPFHAATEPIQLQKEFVTSECACQSLRRKIIAARLLLFAIIVQNARAFDRGINNEPCQRTRITHVLRVERLRS